MQRQLVLRVAIVVLSIASARIASAQVLFHSIPVTNACPAGYAIQPILPVPPCPGLLPGQSQVYNCVSQTIVGTLPHPPYLTAWEAVGSVEIHPPKICYFHGCSLVSVTLDCFIPTFDGKGVEIKDRTTVELKRKAD